MNILKPILDLFKSPPRCRCGRELLLKPEVAVGLCSYCAPDKVLGADVPLYPRPYGQGTTR